MKEERYEELLRRQTHLLQFVMSRSDYLDGQYYAHLAHIMRFWQPLSVYDYFQLMEAKIAYESQQELLALCQTILLGKDV